MCVWVRGRARACACLGHRRARRRVGVRECVCVRALSARVCVSVPGPSACADGATALGNAALGPSAAGVSAYLRCMRVCVCLYGRVCVCVCACVRARVCARAGVRACAGAHAYARACVVCLCA